MADCSRSLKAVGLDVVLCSSDITCYDGPQFACITVPTNATLNQVLGALGNKICEVAESISAPVNASAVVYSGTLIYDCFTLVGANMAAVFESLAEQVCTLADTIPSNADGLERGPSIVYDGGVTPGLAADPISGLFNDIMARMGVMTTDITGLADVDDIARVVGSYFRMSDFVYFGADATPSGLNVTIDDGAGGDSTFGINGYVFDKVSTIVALTATADNYVDIDEDGNIVVIPVAVAAPAPPIATDSMRLYMFTTNALNVTVTVDLRNTYPIISSTMLGDSIVITRNIDNLAVTGAKMETIGAGATVGDADLFIFTYDIKGRVTAASHNYTIAGVAAGDLLRYDGATWVNWVNNFIDGSGSAGLVPRFTDANTVADSTIRDNGTVAAINVAINATRQLYVNATAIGIATAGYFAVSGANATNIGLHGVSTNGTSIDVGVLGTGGASIVFPKATGIAGVVGTAYTEGGKEAFAGFFATDTGGAATDDTFGVYIDAQNSGAGRAYGFVVENGKCLIGAAASTADSALLEIVSTTKGVRFPNMTTVQRDAIAGPVAGLVVFNTTTGVLNFYDGAAWAAV
jgi:hypothetical protein